MNNTTRNVDQHVGELLSGMLDGELTQQQRQLVNLYCESCEACRINLQDLLELRHRIGNARLSETGEDKWRENMTDKGLETPRRVGWILFIGGLLAVLSIIIFEFIFSNDTHIIIKLIFLSIYVGLGTLLYSIVRQALIERKTDKYKDVEI